MFVNTISKKRLCNLEDKLRENGLEPRRDAGSQRTLSALLIRSIFTLTLRPLLSGRIPGYKRTDLIASGEAELLQFISSTHPTFWSIWRQVVPQVGTSAGSVR